ANLMVDFAKSARKEAQVILSQPKTMEQAEKLGMLDHLVHAANSYGAEIRVISPITVENSKLARQIMNQAPNIQILAGPLSTAGLFVQDGERYFIAEDKDPNAAETAEATSRVIYSNSKNGVKSFKSFFEILWKQSQLYEQLRIANEKLILHDNMQKEFINIAAHELRTPIQPILVTAELLDLQFSSEQEKAKKEKGEITRDELAILVRNAKRLERLSSNILDIARIESGTLHLNIQEFNLNDVLSPIVHDTRNDIKKRDKEDVIIHYVPTDNNIVLKGDKDRLSEVMWNLLDNATKFTEKGAISIVTMKDDNYITITIKDSGSGIDSDVLPKLFNKFVTKSEKGTGLGLFISKSIIKAHGGKIWAKNNDDRKGATFTFTLPIQKHEDIQGRIQK
ncbi:MAG: HAMP domain-containing histidine kinase, partial [Thermoproteota archaeon]|nr:HAMP domain-containing histidine kinase [Thermoproteota archaeon]